MLSKVSIFTNAVNSRAIQWTCDFDCGRGCPLLQEGITFRSQQPYERV